MNPLDEPCDSLSEPVAAGIESGPFKHPFGPALNRMIPEALPGLPKQNRDAALGALQTIDLADNGQNGSLQTSTQMKEDLWLQQAITSLLAYP